MRYVGQQIKDKLYPLFWGTKDNGTTLRGVFLLVTSGSRYREVAVMDAVDPYKLARNFDKGVVR